MHFGKGQTAADLELSPVSSSRLVAGGGGCQVHVTSDMCYSHAAYAQARRQGTDSSRPGAQPSEQQWTVGCW